MPAVHADHWAEAQAPGGALCRSSGGKAGAVLPAACPRRGNPAEIAAFMQANPDWPEQAAAEAPLAAGHRSRSRTTRTWCSNAPRRTRARPPPCCAVPRRWRTAGNAAAAEHDARRAWITGHRDARRRSRRSCTDWGGILTRGGPVGPLPTFRLARFAGSGPASGTAGPAPPRAAEAQLALQRDDPTRGRPPRRGAGRSTATIRADAGPRPLPASG